MTGSQENSSDQDPYRRYSRSAAPFGFFIDAQHGPNEIGTAVGADRIGSARSQVVAERSKADGQGRVVVIEEHRHQKPFRSERYQGGGQKAEKKQCGIAVIDQELMHKLSITESRVAREQQHGNRLLQLYLLLASIGLFFN